MNWWHKFGLCRAFATRLIQSRMRVDFPHFGAPANRVQWLRQRMPGINASGGDESHSAASVPDTGEGNTNRVRVPSLVLMSSIGIRNP